MSLIIMGECMFVLLYNKFDYNVWMILIIVFEWCGCCFWNNVIIMCEWIIIIHKRVLFVCKNSSDYCVRMGVIFLINKYGFVKISGIV